MLLGGIAIVGLCVLMPSWRNLQTLQYQHHILSKQAAQLTTQETDYAKLHAALQQQDPTLLERIAYYQLRLKPNFTQPIEPPSPLSPVGMAFVLTPLSAAKVSQSPSLESLLHQPPLITSQMPSTPSFKHSLLTQLTIGTWQPWSLAFGALAIVLGIFWPTQSKTHQRIPVEVEAKDSAQDRAQGRDAHTP